MHASSPERPGAVDDIDAAILRVLTQDAGVTNKELARRVNVAESTCAQRVRSLRARGVIRDIRARVDGQALGMPIQAIVRVRLGTHGPQIVTTLFDAFTRIPGALQVFHIAGVDDFLVHVAARDPAGLRDVVLEHINVHQAVRGTETQLLFEVRDGEGLVP